MEIEIMKLLIQFDRVRKFLFAGIMCLLFNILTIKYSPMPDAKSLFPFACLLCNDRTPDFSKNKTVIYIK